MLINLSPQVSGKKLVVTKKGDALTINGVSLDFTQLPEGGVLPRSAVNCDFIVGSVIRVDGDLVVTLLLPIAMDAPEEATFPSPLVNPPDGKIKFPNGVNV